MNSHQAQDALTLAHRSTVYRPPLPRWVAVACGALTAAAISLAGLGLTDVWLRLATIAAGIALVGLATVLVVRTRASQGIRGARGAARRQWTTLFLCCVVFLISALNAGPSTRWIYVGLGVVGGIGIAVALGRAKPCTTD